ncbi:MAG: TolC family protein, partial [Bacteriovoracaceae bacterium]
MTSIKKGLLWAFIAFGVEATFANEVLNLNEELLKSIVVNSEAPDLIQLEANLTETKARLGEFDDQYSIRAQAESLYAKTYEEPFISFQPIYSPRKAFSVGLAKKTSKGIELSSQVYTDKREYEFSGVDTINSIAGAQVRINLDLWKNIFGRLEASQKKGLKYSVETTKLSNQVQKQVFLNSLRIIYWQIIAKEHSLDIAGELLKTAEKQRDQAIQRLRSSVSDKGEVARYKAQVSSRKNQINILQFEKEQLFQRLRDMIPSFNGMTFVINKPSFDKTIGTVLQCVSYLKTLEETPFEFSSYDEINQSLEKFYNEQIKVSKRYDDVDLKLTSVFNTNGVEPRAQDALDESFKENRAGFEVGLRLDIPFGNLDETGAQKVKI